MPKKKGVHAPARPRVTPAHNIPCNAKMEGIVRAFLLGDTENYSTFWVPLTAIPDNLEVAVGTYHRGYQEFSVSAHQVTACALQGANATKILRRLLRLRLVTEKGKANAVYTEPFIETGADAPVSVQALSTLDAVVAAVEQLYK